MTKENVTSFAKRIGAKIKLLRTLNKLTQTQLAKKAGVSVSNLSRIEKGRANPRFLTLSEISKALNVDIANLFYDKCPAKYI
jgi:transcriptional regulator with XRE-family HTH domain